MKHTISNREEATKSQAFDHKCDQLELSLVRSNFSITRPLEWLKIILEKISSKMNHNGQFPLIYPNRFRKVFLSVMVMFLAVGGVTYAQTSPEAEPNNTVAEAVASSQDRIFEPTTLTGTVSSGDDDYFLIGYDFSMSFPGEFRWWVYFDGNIPAGITVERGVIDNPTGLYAGTESSLSTPFTHCGTFSYTSSFTNQYTFLRIRSTDGSSQSYSITIKEKDPAVTSCFGAAAPNQDVIVPCTAPEVTTLSGITRTGQTTLRLNSFPAVANADGYIVQISENSTFAALPDTYDQPISSTPSSVYSGSGNQIVAQLTSPADVDVSGLSTGSTYTFKVSAYSNCLSNFTKGTGITSTPTPTCGIIPSAPTAMTLNSPDAGLLTIQSIGAAPGGAQGYIVYMSDSPTGFTAPTSVPTANPVYSGSGVQAVYVGSSLTPNEAITGAVVGANTYYFRTYSYDLCDGTYYFDPTGVASSKFICEGAPPAPTVLSLTGVSHSSLNVSSISPVATADGYVVMMNTTNGFTNPADGTSLPAADAVYGGSGHQIVYVGTSSTANTTVTGLDNSNGGVTYYFKAIAYQICEGNIYFEPTGVETFATTRGAAQTVANNAIFFEVGDAFMDFRSFTGAAGATGHVIKMNTSNSFTTPADGSASLPSASVAYTGGEQVIYAGTSASPDFRITGLTAATTYYFSIYTYSDVDGLLYYNQTAYEFSQQNVKPVSSITFSDFTKIYGDAAFGAVTSSNSTGALTYSLVSQTNGGSAVAGNGLVTVGNVGTVTIQVDQVADVDFNPGTAQATMTINKADPIIQFDPVIVSSGAADQTLAATAQVVGSAASASTGTITYNIEGTPPASNSLGGTNNEIWTVGDAGTFTIRASITADANHNAGVQDALFSVSAPAATYFIDPNNLSSLVNGSVSTVIPLGEWRGTSPVGIEIINNRIWTTTQAGGANGKGVLFDVNPNGTSPGIAANFPTSPAFSIAPGIPHEADGKVWILAKQGGASQGGEIYSVNPDRTNFKTEYTFTGVELLSPAGQLVPYNGKLYGAAGFDLTSSGGIYSLTSDGMGGYTYTTELTITTANEKNPFDGLMLYDDLLWYVTESTNRIVAYDPATNTLPHSIDLTEFGYLPIVAENRLFVATENYIYEIQKVGASYTRSTVYSFTTPDARNWGNLSFDGVDFYGIGRNPTTTFGFVYKVGIDGTGFEIVYNSPANLFAGSAINVVERLTPEITFTDQTVDHLSVTALNATSNSTGAITYELISDPTASGLTGNQFTAGNAGTVTIRASLAQDVNFNAATKDVTFTIQKVDPTFTMADVTLPFASAVQTLAPSATNYTGGTITYQFVDGAGLATTGPNTGSTISGDQLTVLNPGTETIRATLPVNSNFNAATVDFQLTVNNAVADLSGFVDITTEFFQPDVTLSVASAPGIAVSYQLLTSNTGSSLSGTNNETLSIGNVAGAETIRVTVTESNYQATTKDITLTVNKATPALAWATPSDIQFAIEALDASRLNASASIAGSITYWIGEVDFGTQITPGATTMSLGANQQLTAQFFPTDTDNYQEATISVNINATKINLELTVDDKVWVIGQAEPALTFTITQGAIVPSHTLFFPISRAAGTAIGTYAINVDNTAQSPDAEYDDGGFSCPFGLCIYKFEGFIGDVPQMADYNITIVPGTFTITDKSQITASDITFIPPASLTFDATAKTYSFSVATLDPVLPLADIDLTYEGRNGTVYASSATAPTNGGDYNVIATVKTSNLDYGGSVSENLTIAPFVTTINLNLPGSNLIYNGMAQGINPLANDLSSIPTVALTTEYGIAGTGFFSETIPVDAGTYDVRVNIAATEPSYSAVQATGSYTIDQTPQAITFNPIPDVECGQTMIDLSLYASSSTGATLSFASDNAAVATVSGSVLTVVGAGSGTITASQVGDANTVAAIDQIQTLTIAAVQENFSVDNPADVLVCNGMPYILPALTTGNYFSAPGGTGTAYNPGDPIASTTTLYVYGVSGVNVACTDENSFTISIDNLPVDNLPNVTAVGSYTLPTLTNGNYYTGTGATGTELNAGDPISSTQTVYIYNEDLALGCSSESSFVVSIEIAPALHFEQVVNFTDYDYLSVPDDNSLDFTTHFTYEAWVNFEQLTVGNAGFGWRSFFQKSRYTDSYGLMVYAPTKLMRFYHTGVGGGFTDYTWSSLSAGAWHHVAVKWDGTNSKTSILIDGVEVSSNTSATGSLVVNTLPLLIGAGDDRANDPYPFDGVMDEIRFWNIARTDAEINASKDAELAGTESGLVLYYNFSEGTIDGDNSGLTQVTDRSTAGNNATFNSFALTGTTSNFVDGSGNGVVPGLPQSITFNPLSNVTFGGADFNLAASASSGLDVSYVSSNTSVATISGNTLTVVGVGTTTITASQGGSGIYLPASDVDQALTVDPFNTAISLNLPGSNLTYTGVGQGIAPTANDASSNPTLALVTEYSVQGANSFSTSFPVNTGIYDVRANLNVSETNYTASEATGTFTIDKAPLTATLDDVSIVYSEAGANNHPTTYTGFVNGETQSVLSIATNWPQASYLDGSSFYSVGGPYTGATIWEANAELQITSANYAITFEAGNITSVTARPINITADNRTITYGEDANTANMVTFEANNGGGMRGLASGETNTDFSGTLSFANIAQTNVGYYTGAILPSGLTNSNYNITYVAGDLEIIERDLTIQGNNRTTFYGDDPNVGNTVSYSGFITGEDESILTGTLTFSNISFSAVGSYSQAISPNGLSNSNYNILFEGGDLTIDPRPLTVTADNRTITYGSDANTGNSVTYTGFASGETEDDLSGTLAFANITQTDAGTYSGVITPSGLSSGNYAVAFVDGDLTIDPLAIEVTADAQSKMVGEADPTFAYTVTGGTLVGMDAFSGSLTRVSGESVGTYAITQGSLTAGTNYDLTYIANDLTINLASQSITFGALADVMFGDADFSLGATASSGLAVSYVSSDPAVATVSGNMVTIVGVGTTNITASQAGDASYSAAPDEVQSLTVAHGNYERYFVKVNDIYGMTAAHVPVLVKTLSTAEGQNIEDLKKVDNQIWGTTISGGANSMGTLFRMDPDGGNFEVLHDFTVAEGNPRNDMAVVADTDVYGVAGDYGIFKISVTNTAAGPTFYNSYSGSNKFVTGLTYHQDKLWVSDNGTIIVGVNTDFSGHEIASQNTSAGGFVSGNPTTDFIVEGYRMMENFELLNIAFFPHYANVFVPSNDWLWGSANEDVANLLPVPVEDIPQTKIIFADGQYFHSRKTGGQFGIEVTEEDHYNSTLGFGSVTKATIPALSGAIGTTDLASLSKPYFNLYDVKDNILWGIRGDAATGLHEAFSYNLTTGVYQAYDFGSGNLNVGVPNAGFFNFRKTATLVTQNQTKAYGDPIPSFTYEVWGLDAGDDASTIGGVTTSAEVIYGSNFNPTTMLTSTTHPGIYPIKSVADTANGKYDLRHLFGNITITYAIQQADIVFSPATTNYTYDGTAKAFSAVGKAGTPAGASGITHDLSGRSLGTTDFDYTYVASTDGGMTYTVDLAATAPTDAGMYRVTATVKSTNTVYSGSTTFDFEITPIAVTVTPNANQSRIYDGTDVAGDDAIVYSFDPVLVGSDVFSGALTRVPGSAANTYNIEIGTLSAGGNYVLTLAPETFEITPMVITVTPATNQNKVYDGTNVAGDPEITFTYTPLLVSDALTGTLTRAAGSDVNTYPIVIGSLSAGGNYALSLASETFEIKALAITVTPNPNQKKAFDGQGIETDPTLTYTHTPALIGSDAFTGALTRVNGSNVDTYAIQQGTLSAGSNYALNFRAETFEITTLAVTVTPDAGQTKTYDAMGTSTDPTITYQVSPALTGSDAFTGALSRASGSDAGIYAIEIGSLATTSNYAVTLASENFQIETKGVLLRANSVSKTYDGMGTTTDPEISFFHSPDLLGSDVFTGALSRTEGSDAGTYPVNLGTLSAGSNYELFPFPGGFGDFTITPLDVTIMPDPGQSKVYDGSGTATDPTLTYTGNLLDSDTFNGALIRAAGAAVNTYAIEVGTLGAGSNYNLSVAAETFEITPLSITVTPDPGQNKTYDAMGVATDPVLTYTHAPALLGSDVITGALARTAGSDVNTYAIEMGTLTGGNNYSISLDAETFEIVQREVTVTADVGQSKVYGQPDPVAYTFTPTPALLAGDGFVGVLTRVAGEGAGTYAIQQGTLTAGSNYAITFNGDDFNIVPIDLSITADDKTKTLGTSDPTLTHTLTSGTLINGDMLTGTLTRVAGETVGDYVIQQGTLTAGGNYNINFTEGNLTITDKLVQSITFNVLADVTYGDAAFTLSATGGGSGIPVTFAGDDNSVATITSNGDVTIVGAGTVNITANQAGDATYVAADPVVQTLTVNKKGLIVTADDQNKTYGDVNPTLTVSYSGFAGADDASVLNTAPLATTTADATSVAGDYTITAGGGSDDNYSFTLVNGTLTIGKATLTATANDKNRAYGTSNPSFDITYTGFVNSEDASVIDTAPTATATATETSHVGDYAITASGGSDNNYSFNYVDGTLTVGQATLTATANDKNRAYGATNPSFDITYTGFANSEDASVIDTAPTATTTATETSHVGDYGITASGGSDNNYSFNYVDGTLTVGQATLTAMANDKSRAYGATNPAFDIAYTGFVNSEDASVIDTAPIATTTATETSHVGDYGITATGGSDNNYSFNYVDGTLTVGQATLTATANDKSRAYGTSNPTLDITYTGFVNSDDVSMIDTAPTAITVATETSNAGDYVITASGGSDNNYSFNYVHGTLTVSQAALTASANDKSKAYGAINPSLGITYTGFANSDDVSVIDTTPVATTTATETSNVGEYAIIASGGSDNNYSFNYVDGTLTVSQATLTATANDKSRAYGAPNPSLDMTYTGFVNSDDASVIDTTPTATTVATETSNVGDYAITGSGGSDNNYSFNYVDGTLTIGHATLTATANDKNRSYGASNPAFDITYTGFANSDDASVIDTAPTATTVATEMSNVGDYAITISTGNDNNYSFNYVDGTLTIGHATLTATANDKNRSYGASNPAFDITYTGFVNRDDASVIDTAPTATTVATETSNVGDYAIKASGGTDNNYSFSYVDGTLTVGHAILTATANDKSRAYGASNPTLDFTYTGFVNGENASVIDTSPAATTTATETSNVGDYVINGSGGSDNNYSFNYVDGTLTIGQATLTATTNDKNRSYGASNPAFDITYTGFVNSDDASMIDTVPTATTVATETSNVGNYAITISTGSDDNYSFNYVDGTLTIGQATLTATANDKSRSYGASNPSLDITYTGFVNSDDASVIDTAPTATTVATETSNVGDYAITGSGGSDNNYSFNYVDGTLIIGQATLTATANDKNRSYGASNPVFDITYTGFVNSDGASVIDTAPTATTIATETSNVGDYAITGSGGSDNNYSFNYVDGTLIIGQAILTAKANDKNRAYGASNPTLDITYTGFVNSENVSVIDTAPTATTTATETSYVGDYVITASGGSDNNYSLNYVHGTLTINKKTLTVMANNKTITYGDDQNVGHTIAYSGFILGENESTLGGTLSFANISQSTAGVHNGVIIPSGLSSSNYDIGYTNGNLTINPRALGITAEDKIKTIGATAPALTYQVTSGSLINGDEITGSLSRVVGETVGDYTINQGNLTAGNNYAIDFTSGKLTITNLITQVITFNTLEDKTYGDPTFDLTATGGTSGNAVTYMSSDETVATISGSTVTIVGAGNTNITAAQAGNATHAAATDVVRSLTINKAALSALAENKARVYGAANPELTIAYSGFVNGEGVANITAPTIATTANGASDKGSYPITLTGGSGGGNYTLTTTDGTLTVNQATLIATAEDKNRTYGAANPTLTIVYAGFVNGEDVTVLDTAPTATTSASTTTNAGSYDITVAEGADNNYALNYVNGTLTVDKATLTAVADDKAREFGAANPTLTVSYTGFVNGGASSDIDTAPTATTTAALTSAVGTYDIDVSGGSDNNYDFSYASGTLTVSTANQTITFEALDAVTFGDMAFNLTATASSGLTVSYTSSNTDVATVSGSTVTIVGAGTATITASQEGDANYNTASDVIQNLVVNQATQSITFDALPDVDLSVGTVSLTATASSTLEVSYSVVSGPAIVAGSVLTLTGEGTVEVMAMQEGNDNYTAANTVTQSFNVTDGAKQDQTITFEALNEVTFGDTAFELNGTASSGLAVSYTSSNTEVVTVSGSTITIIGAGTTTITASQSGDDTFNSAASVSQTLTVNKADQTISFGALNAVTYGDTAFDLTATSSSDLLVSYTSSNTAVATVSGSTVTIVGAGTTSITASQSGDANYNTATEVVQNLVVNKATQTITFTTIGDKTLQDSPITLQASASSGLAVNYTLLEGDGVVSGDILTINNVGTFKVAADQSGDDNHLAAATVEQTFSVTDPSKQDQAIAFDAIADKFYGDVFSLNATASSNLEVTYAVLSGPAVLVGNEVTITGVGEVSISATQIGDESFNAAGEVIQNFMVSKVTLTVTADNQTIEEGGAIPILTFSYAGFVNGEDATVIDTPPKVSTTATVSSVAGDYPIELIGGEDNNYSMTLVNGTLTIELVTALADEILNKVKVYPMPFERVFNIQLPEKTSGTYKLVISGLDGRQVFTQELNGLQLNHQIEGLKDMPEGLYIVQLGQDKSLKTFRIVKR